MMDVTSDLRYWLSFTFTRQLSFQPQTLPKRINILQILKWPTSQPLKHPLEPLIRSNEVSSRMLEIEMQLGNGNDIVCRLGDVKVWERSGCRWSGDVGFAGLLEPFRRGL